MDKKLLAGTIGLAGLAVAIGVGAGAYRGDVGRLGPNYNPERYEAMEKALENNDFNTWKELMSGRGKASEVVTEKNFSRFAEMHRLREAGRYEEANAIRQELGLGFRGGQGRSWNVAKKWNQGGFIDQNQNGVCDHRE